ncbi:MAG: carboxymuconolactone decarboxylase family protein [Rhodospirillales bacterium]|nr:carboxymuconolactone decarboxylase family protein [Rhodospirillales bacterium]
MSLSALADRIPDYAKDIKLNLSSILSEETLNPQQLYGTLLATALAARNPDVIAAASAECASRMTPEAQAAAKAAHAIMAMNNIYYKFTGMVTNPEYKGMQSRLRMNILANPGVEKKDFELWSLAVSAINGCKFCLDSHEARLLSDGMTKEQVQTAVRIAATIHAVATVLAGEEALQAGIRHAA